MKRLYIILFSLSLITCGSNYDCDDLEFKDGFMHEKSTGELANGSYYCYEKTDNYSHPHEYRCIYKNGLRIGEWQYHYNHDLIQFGESIQNKELEALIASLAKPVEVEINTFYEGSRDDFGWLYIDLIKPKNTLDSNDIQKIEIQAKEICKEYQITDIIFRKFENGKFQTISNN